MRRVEIPSLVIHGGRDRSAPIEISGKPSARLLRNCRLVTYDDAPHGLMCTHLDRLYADILRFLREA
ncbi:MAG: alpha/beta fold hydrolase [Acetobacteraceae bacterium]